MSQSKNSTLVEKLILFAVFLVFAGIVVAFAFQWNYVDDSSDLSGDASYHYVTSSKVRTTDITSNGATVSGKVNINTATVEELDSLPGIGPAKAEAIVKYRESESVFFTPEDIMNVSGIGEKTFESLKDYIVVE